MGRYLERATAIANLLDLYQPEILQTPEVAAEGQQYQEWVGLLRCCTAFEAYCKVYTADITADQILEFLLLNPQFPHSLRYSVDCLRQALVAVQQSSGKPPVDHLTRISGKLQASRVLSKFPTFSLRMPGPTCTTSCNSAGKRTT